MDLTTTVYKRDYTVPLILAPLQLEPTSYSWDAIGGPDQANITVWGDVNSLWDCAQMLRCPVEISDARGELNWWGYVAEVEIRTGAITVGLSLDAMANNIAVAYTYVAPGTIVPGVRKTTAWSSDADSVAEYGTKELLLSASGLSDAQATGMQAAALAARRYPVPTVSMMGENGLSATLTCRGWWDTLRWRYYGQSGTANTVTTTQIGDILTAEGEFVTAATIETASGISSGQYRKGDKNAQQEIVNLLAAGTSGGSRYLASVLANRTLRVYTEPASSATGDYMLASDGLLYDQYGQPILPHTCPVGFWARLKDVIPDTADLTLLAKPSSFFVQRAEYVIQGGRLRLEARDTLGAFDVGGLQAG